MNEQPGNRWWTRDWFLALLLVVASFVAYQPAWNGQPVFDDDDHLTPPELRSVSGLARIWTQVGAVSQYYPLAHTVFWIEDKLWGSWMPGYHVVNILLHALAALLLARILKQLKVPGAWLAAALFALHPVQVESVAWISELKNTLSGVFYLTAALIYLRFDGTRRIGWYVAALALFAFGLLSKSVVATLPAALLVVFWWKRGQLSWKQDVQPLLPFFVAGIGMGLLTAWVERKFIGAEGEAFQLTAIERGLVAGRALWFYLGKLAWPANLIFIYPRWTVSQAAWWQYLFPASALLLFVGAWALRARNRGLLAALLIFTGTLFPALGFFNVYPFRYSFVADHYQYLASLGILTAAAAGAVWVLRRLNLWERPAGVASCLLVLTTLAGLSWRQSRQYVGVETLWRTTLARNPDCFVAYSNLGNHLLETGHVDEAIRCCQKAIELQPGFAEIHNNLGNAFLQKGWSDDAIREYQKALELRPGLAAAHFNLGNVLLQRGADDEALACFQKAVDLRPEFVKARNNLGSVLLDKGRVDEAMVHIRKALEIRPDDPDAHINFGNALLQKGQVEDAIAHYRKALAVRPNDAKALNNLGSALAQKGQLDEALNQFNLAVTAQPGFSPGHSSLGNVLLQKGKVDEAIFHFQEALKHQPADAKTHNDLGNALLQRGRLDEAIASYQKALEIRPDYELAHYNFGYALLQKDRVDEAIVHFQQALALRPDFVQARYYLGNSLLRKGQVDDAITQFQKTLVLAPELAEAHGDLANAWLQKGDARAALAHCRTALKSQSDNPDTLSLAAWILATCPEASIRNGAEALRLAQRAIQVGGGRDAMTLRALAAASAEGGKFPEAIRAAQQALELAAARTNIVLADALRSELKLYETGVPFRETRQ